MGGPSGIHPIIVPAQARLSADIREPLRAANPAAPAKAQNPVLCAARPQRTPQRQAAHSGYTGDHRSFFRSDMRR
jgi:hypothetical protein